MVNVAVVRLISGDKSRERRSCFGEEIPSAELFKMPEISLGNCQVQSMVLVLSTILSVHSAKLLYSHTDWWWKLSTWFVPAEPRTLRESRYSIEDNHELISSIMTLIWWPLTELVEHGFLPTEVQKALYSRSKLCGNLPSSFIQALGKLIQEGNFTHDQAFC